MTQLAKYILPGLTQEGEMEPHVTHTLSEYTQTQALGGGGANGDSSLDMPTLCYAEATVSSFVFCVCLCATRNLVWGGLQVSCPVIPKVM